MPLAPQQSSNASTMYRLRLLPRLVRQQQAAWQGGERQHSVVAAPAVQKSLVGLKYLAGCASLLAGGALGDQVVTEGKNTRLALLIPTRLARDVYCAASIVSGEGQGTPWRRPYPGDGGIAPHAFFGRCMG